MVPDASRGGRGHQQQRQQQRKNDAAYFHVPKNAHGIKEQQSTPLIVGQTCGENNWLHFLELRQCNQAAITKSVNHRCASTSAWNLS